MFLRKLVFKLNLLSVTECDLGLQMLLSKV